MSSEKNLDFTVISPAKTASTWLYALFAKHPQCNVALTKEPHYFSRYWNVWSLEDYYALFADRPGLTGDVSTSYALLSRERVADIRLRLPDLKIVAILREPKERLWSHVRFDFPDKTKAGTAFQMEALRHHCMGQRGLETTFMDNVHVTLRHWAELFPAEQLFFTTFDRLLDPDSGTLEALFRFLDLDPELIDPETRAKIVNQNPNDTTITGEAFNFSRNLTWETSTGLGRLFSDLGQPQETEAWTDSSTLPLANADAAHLLQVNLREQNVYLYRGWYVSLDTNLVPMHFGLDGKLKAGQPAHHALLQQIVAGQSAVIDVDGKRPAFRSRFHSKLCSLSAMWECASPLGQEALRHTQPGDEFNAPLGDSLELTHTQHGQDAPVLINSEQADATYNIVFYRSNYHAVPVALGSMDLAKEDVSRLPGVISCSSIRELWDILALVG